MCCQCFTFSKINFKIWIPTKTYREKNQLSQNQCRQSPYAILRINQYNLFDEIHRWDKNQPVRADPEMKQLRPIILQNLYVWHRLIQHQLIEFVYRYSLNQKKVWQDLNLEVDENWKKIYIRKMHKKEFQIKVGMSLYVFRKWFWAILRDWTYSTKSIYNCLSAQWSVWRYKLRNNL